MNDKPTELNFNKLIAELNSDPDLEYNPKPFYNSYGDFIEYHIPGREEGYADVIDKYLTVFRQEGGSISGIQITRVKDMEDF